MNLAIARRNPNSPKVLALRPLVPADLESLRKPSAGIRINKIRESHHNIARLAAAGLKQIDIAARLGYTQTRISLLLKDPSMVELVASYRAQVTEAWREQVDQMSEYAISNMLTSERMISERLEDIEEGEAEPLPIRELIALTSDRMDRFGYGKKETRLNINADFGKKLEAAITRSRKAA